MGEGVLAGGTGSGENPLGNNVILSGKRGLKKQETLELQKKRSVLTTGRNHFGVHFSKLPKIALETVKSHGNQAEWNF